MLSHKKDFTPVIQQALKRFVKSEHAREAAKAVYAAVQEHIAESLIVLAPIEGDIDRFRRVSTICETLRRAYSAETLEEAREHISLAYNYGQRMNEKLTFYRNREADNE